MAHSVTCKEFLRRYSDYRDGIIEGRERLHLEGHLAVCRQCQAYDARVARGVIVLQNSGEIEPSPDLRQQLRERIAAGRRRDFQFFPAYAGVLAGLLLIASLGVLLWETEDAPVQTVVADSTLPISEPLPPVVSPATLNPTDASLAVPAFGADWRAPGANEEPYIIKPALTR